MDWPLILAVIVLVLAALILAGIAAYAWRQDSARRQLRLPDDCHLRFELSDDELAQCDAHRRPDSFSSPNPDLGVLPDECDDSATFRYRRA